jgi:selenocysteine lyase/cysteine desulfurase
MSESILDNLDYQQESANILNISKISNMSNVSSDSNISNTLDLMDVPNIMYKQGKILNPFTKKYNKIIFADDTASGRPCRSIEKSIEQNVFPYYSNTHSNATCGTIMKDFVDNTKEIIRDVMNVSSFQKIIFCGSGCTGAVNHLINSIDFSAYSKIRIHSSAFEHHSNFLPWVEKLNEHKKIYPETDIEYVNIDSDEKFNLQIDDYVNGLDSELKLSKQQKSKTNQQKSKTNQQKSKTNRQQSKTNQQQSKTNQQESNQILTTNNSPGSLGRLDIFTLIGCSNVTGKRYDLSYEKLWDFIKIKKNEGFNMYLLIDHACTAPYIKIDLSRSDGVFFSGHKFLGGQCTPGVLIVNEELLTKNKPYQPGGGCVDSADITSINYKQELEAREMCGTPNIVGIIRLGYVLANKQSLMDVIEHNEKTINNYVTQKLKDLEKKYERFRVIGLDYRTKDDMPIYPITIKGMHYNLITVALNDIFGIQTRGGLSCCGTFGLICKDIFNVNGWCRISFSYLLKKTEIDKILYALDFVIRNRKSLKTYYSYDHETNMYYYSGEQCEPSENDQNITPSFDDQNVTSSFDDQNISSSIDNQNIVSSLNTNNQTI